MPVDFAHGAGLDDHQRGGEGERVEDLDGAAGKGEWVLARPVVGVCGFDGDLTGGGVNGVLLRDILWYWRAVEDVELVGGEVLEV